MTTHVSAQETPTTDPAAGETDPAVLGLYQDASNFQTNNAFDLAIESWGRLLDEHRDSPLAGKAAHYLGVCHMQTQPPDLRAAAAAFERAIDAPANELQRESLINAGYCYFAMGQSPADDAAPANAAQEDLRRSMALHRRLVDDPQIDRFTDQANFYLGEAAYALGELPKAIEAYNRILDNSGESTYRCDAAYAAGIALEDLGRTEEAVAAYEKFLAGCPETIQTADVLLRLGDLLQAMKRYEDAKDRYQAVAKLDPNVADDEDRAYAALQRGVVLSAEGDYPKAAAIYEAILNRYADTDMAPVARFAAAKTLYLTKQNEKAAVRFAEVLQSPQDVAQATEAAHWLARINLMVAESTPTIDGGPIGESKLAAAGDDAARQAADMALRRITEGTDGPYAEALRLDAAEALSFLPDRLDEAAARFDSLYADGPTEDLAARALYQGAFVKLQLKRYDEAIRDASTFKQRFAGHRLYAEAVAVLAEAAFLDQNYELAAAEFTALLEDKRYDDAAGREGWIVRAAAASGRAGRHARVDQLLGRELDRLTDPAKKAEALLTLGESQMALDQPQKAAETFAASRTADPKGLGGDVAFLKAADAQVAAGQTEAAIAIWKELIATSTKPDLVAKARYRLGSLQGERDLHAEAIETLRPLLDLPAADELLPYARYATAVAQLRLDRSEPAERNLTALLEQSTSHPLADDARLARGLARRQLKRYDDAAEDLQTYVKTNPAGGNPGLALYELALIASAQDKPKLAVERLTELQTQVPGYEDMAGVLYQKGVSQRAAGQPAESLETFKELIDRFPDDPAAPEAAFLVGARAFENGDYQTAAKSLAMAAGKTDADLARAQAVLYRLGWSYYNLEQYEAAEDAFKRQFALGEAGSLYLDAMLMIGESRFRRGEYATAERAYSFARRKIQADNDTSATLSDNEAARSRQLVLLHGGQAAAQLKRYEEAIGWYEELRRRFPATDYLAQAFYETGFAYRQMGRNDEAKQFLSQVADRYRDATAARARFMLGEIEFEASRWEDAIRTFQQVMFGFGADKAPPDVKNWQAKSGFEAARCGERLIAAATTEPARQSARSITKRFYQYVVDQHPGHELAPIARQKLGALN